MKFAVVKPERRPGPSGRQEVTLAILLAWLLLGEAPPPSALVGAGITVLGVALILAP